MPKANKAIIMAAGQGTRLHPLTSNTPKPLLKVKDKCLIETCIQSLCMNKIQDIYIVVGYKKEQFIPLSQKYKGVKLIENPFYSQANNIASLYAARNLLCNAIIMDGDQFIVNPNIMNPIFKQSCYCCAWTDTPTTEWILEEQNGRVMKCYPDGGKKGWQLFSVSFWSKEDGIKLKRHVEKSFNNQKNHHLYWDDIVLMQHLKEYNLGIKPIKKSDIFEVDTFKDLKRLNKQINKGFSGGTDEY